MPSPPGRMEPSIRRAVTVLLARRADLPPGLAAELDSWKLTLDALDIMESLAATPASHAAAARAIHPAKPLRTLAAG